MVDVSRDKKGRTVIADGAGASVAISKQSVSSDVEFYDASVNFWVNPNSFNIVGYDSKVQAGNPNKYLFGTTGWYKGAFYCEGKRGKGRIWPFQGMVRASDSVQESVARERILDFSIRHPEIAQKLRELKVPLTIMGGRSATLNELEKYPSCYQACPKDESTVIIKNLCSRP